MKRIVLLLLLITCSILGQTQKNSIVLESILQKDTFLSKIISKADSFRLQIIYTEINRDKNNIPHFKDHYFRLKPEEYFYPASTVKMPMAFLALEKINNLHLPEASKNALMTYDSVSGRQETIYNNPYSLDGKQSIHEAIKEIFLVSDNNAANRLFEFLGQQYIHDQLEKKGYKNVYIRNRLELPRTQEESRQTQAINFIDDQGKTIYHQKAQYNPISFPNYNVFIGKGYYNSNDSLIQAPLDFSVKNKIPLQDLHHILQSVLFYNQTPAHQRFNLTKEDQSFLFKWMHTTPPESTYPTYDTAEIWSTYCKFLLMGSEKKPIPPHIKIFNKVGDAYGFLLDIAYVVDTVNKVEFMTSAVIYCNQDGILNDSKYDYDTIGYPFYKHLGEALYQHELQRPKAVLPKFDTILP
jgi:hypothetical protein